ncbi:MAG: acyl-CoA thioesterase [Candidatus Eisenbacteria bacterium]|uniref:Acyl-CoA thioesterase n=1 Tax=Eiseniibacteriota bacterium TaxID=2212470 RepID=A0A849SI32_UNCEI|nr:acyl-CoA thioesterase [Candidatus Eisenbacteria bacterium]
MGVAYYGNYLRWFEIGRAEMLRALGTTYRAVEASGIRLPVLEAHCRYRLPARYDDRLEIETRVESIGRATVRFEYRIFNADEQRELANGWTEHCFLDLAGRPVKPSAELRELLERGREGNRSS